ncbi:Protein kinase superfamily protein [Zea mays]|uniref:Protein kinase superfamily protein n=1 Tax=Zea mays TaxID=4577 RepID=A0A1D6JL74_MAIZE|nr:Protein kinase superfamily protein [Zea mays]
MISLTDELIAPVLLPAARRAKCTLLPRRNPGYERGRERRSMMRWSLPPFFYYYY